VPVVEEGAHYEVEDRQELLQERVNQGVQLAPDLHTLSEEVMVDLVVRDNHFL
jgi:hypothetical protein